MTIRIVKEMKPGQPGQRVCLVQDEASSKYFVASSVSAAFDTGLPETLVFPATKTGKITSWIQTAGGQGLSREEALAELESVLRGGKRSPSPGLGGGLYDAFNEMTGEG